MDNNLKEIKRSKYSPKYLIYKEFSEKIEIFFRIIHQNNNKTITYSLFPSNGLDKGKFLSFHL
jgi:hypothetical protein